MSSPELRRIEIRYIFDTSFYASDDVLNPDGSFHHLRIVSTFHTWVEGSYLKCCVEGKEGKIFLQREYYDTRHFDARDQQTIAFLATDDLRGEPALWAVFNLWKKSFFLDPEFKKLCPNFYKVLQEIKEKFPK